MKRSPTELPDPWLFDSEALLRELDRCRELILQIPITNPNATHFGIGVAVDAVWNLRENLRYLLHLHREGQRSFRRKHDAEIANALSKSKEARKVASFSGRPKRISHPAPRAPLAVVPQAQERS